MENKIIQEQFKSSILEERQKFISKATDTLLQGLDIDEAEMNSRRADLQGRVKKVLTLTDKGVRLELIPPEPDFSDEAESKVSKTDQKKTLEQVTQIQEMNAKLTPIYLSLPADLLLLEEEEEPEEEEQLDVPELNVDVASPEKNEVKEVNKENDPSE